MAKLPYDTNTLLKQSKAMLEQTKAEGSKAYAGSSYDIGAATPPTDASKVKKQKEPAVPNLKPEPGDIANAMAGVASTSAYSTSSQKDLNEENKERRLAEEEKRSETTMSLFEKFFGKGGKDVTSPMEAREDAWEDTGINVKEYFRTLDAGVKEIETLNLDYEKTKAERDAKTALIEENQIGALQTGVDQRVLQTEKLYNSRLSTKSAEINAKAATLQAKQGNFAEAQKYVNQAVQDATADTKFKYDMFKAFDDMNQENFDNVDQIYSDAFKESMALAKAEYDRDYDEKTQVAEWMIKYPNAGIGINDDMATAAKKASTVSGTGTTELTADMKNYEYAKKQGYTGTFADFIGKGTDSSASAYMDVMQAAIDEGATPEEAARAAAAVSEGAGIQVDQPTLNSWAAVARKLQPTPKPMRETTISAPRGNYSPSSGEKGPTLTSIYNSLFGD